METTKRQRPINGKALCITLCGLFLLGLWAAQATPYLNPANDSGRYMVLGESLARTGELRLINDVRRLPDTLYPPGYPALIAAWLLATGRQPGAIVLAVKTTEILLLIACLPLLWRLYARAGLRGRFLYGAMVATALCPSLVAYSNEVMSEIPFLLLCLIAVALLETLREIVSEESDPPPPPRPSARLWSIVAGAAAFLVRSAALPLMAVQTVWLWRKFGWKWAMTAAVCFGLVVGAWQMRNRRIIAHAPAGVVYDTYMRQLSLKDPMDPKAGRIQLTPLGLAGRARRSFPLYIGFIPRAVLNSMSLRSTAASKLRPRQSAIGPWTVLFYAVAAPLAFLSLAGWVLAWRRGLLLSAGFATLFWLTAALWPWKSDRFLVPLVPLILLFAALALQALLEAAARRNALRVPARAAALLFCGLYGVYCLHVSVAAVAAQKKVSVSGYALGRNAAEGGFYAACDWLRTNGEPGAVVMGRPAYLLHLYSQHPTTQVEPNTNPRVQEAAYMLPRHVAYVVLDRWGWASTGKYLAPYLAQYGSQWQQVFVDPRGSGVTVWKRLPPAAAPVRKVS